VAPRLRYRPTWRGFGLGVLAWVLLLWATGIVRVWGAGPAVNGIRVHLLWGPEQIALLLAVSVIVCLAGESLWRGSRSSESNA
jgi:hypothetical protein